MQAQSSQTTRALLPCAILAQGNKAFKSQPSLRRPLGHGVFFSWTAMTISQWHINAERKHDLVPPSSPFHGDLECFWRPSLKDRSTRSRPRYLFNFFHLESDVDSVAWTTMISFSVVVCFKSLSPALRF